MQTTQTSITATAPTTAAKKSLEYYVCHGGNLLGLGVWSSGHRTMKEAQSSARKCRMIVGGSPSIETRIA